MAAKKKKSAAKKKAPTKAELQLARELFARAAANAEAEDGGPAPENTSQLSKLDEKRIANRKRIAELHKAMNDAKTLSWEEVLYGVDVVRRMAMEDGEYGAALAASKMLVEHLPRPLPKAGDQPKETQAPRVLSPGDHLEAVKALKERGVRVHHGEVVEMPRGDG